MVMREARNRSNDFENGKAPINITRYIMFRRLLALGFHHSRILAVS
jgi:hypothetical protein